MNTLLKHPLVTLALGIGATAADGIATVYRIAVGLPVLGGLLDRRIAALSGRGEQLIADRFEPTRSTVAALAAEIVDLVLAELDVAALVRNRVDIDAIVTDVDIEGIIARIDLVGLADTVIDGVDLPRIIRDSTTSVTADVMTDVRGQGERADDAVSGFVDRLLGRSQ